MPGGRKPYVFDTNVAVVANRREGGSYDCAAACARHILAVRANGILILDSNGLILDEYRKYLNVSGQPGMGDVFLRWLINNRGRVDLCRSVLINEATHKWKLFDEFPDDDRLKSFDPSDQKFVAAARAHGSETEILQASDHKWLEWAPALREHKVNVRFICEDELKQIAATKKKLG